MINIKKMPQNVQKIRKKIKTINFAPYPTTI